MSERNASMRSRRPQAPPPPLLPGGYTLTGPCSITDGGSCATSPNYPESYGGNERCTITGVPRVVLEVVAFDVQGDYYSYHSYSDYDRDGDSTNDCSYDYLTVNGERYCGTSGPEGVVVEDGVIEWVSHYDHVASGWKARPRFSRRPLALIMPPPCCQICWATGPPASPPSPPPPPLAPLPPLFPGFVTVTAGARLRSLIEEATADISIFLAPGAHLKLRNQVSCTSNITVTVASSGEGATLDGQGFTGFFYLSGGCSLTLRWLTLVNGRTDSHGGVVYAYVAGDIEIIGSTVANCSAYVRRVELAASGSAAQQRGERQEGHGCLTPLSPRNRRTAASSTRLTAVRSR